MIPVQRLTPELRSRLAGRRGAMEDRVRAAVDEVEREFRKDSDGAIRALAKRFDQCDLQDIEVGPEEIAAAEAT